MFPDPSAVWIPYPSIIDGITGPYISDQGIPGDDLCLAVVGRAGTARAYGVKIDSLIHAGYDDLLYSAAYPKQDSLYDGSVYIKEAQRSALLSRFSNCRSIGPVRHFLFVGGNLCYEVLARSEPEVFQFEGLDEAVNWHRQDEWVPAWT